MTGARSGRRPALDGLRALAVLAVLLYHGGVTWAGGGFIGVDVFFVLSGFLITWLLLDEVARTGRVDLSAFARARGRRLLPALAALVIAVLWVFPAFGVRWPQAARADGLAALLGVANWRFLASGQSYVDQVIGPSPFLHTWSLGIEFQWYITFPALVLVLLATRPRWLGARLPLALVLTALAIASAALAWLLHPDGADISRAYYGTDTRVQELLVGAVLAAAAGQWLWTCERPSRWLDWAGWPALALLAGLAHVAQPDSDWLYRGGLLLVAAAAAVVLASVVAAGERPRRLTPAGLLSSPPLVALGVISYGVYLWHWPLFLALTPDRVGVHGTALVAVKLVATVALAAASYWLVEKPLRGKRVRRQMPSTRVFGLTLSLLAAAALAFPAAFAAPADDPLLTASAAPAPTISPSTADSTIVFVGDSQAVSVFAAVRSTPGTGVQLQLAARLGCGVVPYVATAAGQRLEPPQPMCGDWARDREREIGLADADLAVLWAGTWEQYDREVGGHDVAYTSPRWRELTTAAYRQVLLEMSRQARHLAVVLDQCHRAPDPGLPVETLYQWGRYPPVVNDPARVAAVNAAIRAAAATLPAVTVVDPGRLLCQGGYHSRLDGVTLHTDGVHLTAGGSRLLWDWMRPQLLAAAH